MTSSPASANADHALKFLPFWERLLNDQDLRDCAPLEKLLIGCELIAALDEGDLLAA